LKILAQVLFLNKAESISLYVYMLKRIIFLALILSSMAKAHALSLGVPKGLIDIAVIKKFPMEKYTLAIDHPTTKFKKELSKIELCGTWSEKLTHASGEFCVDVQPRWNKSKGDIEISKVNILKINSKDLGELPVALSKTLNATVLILLDGISIYHMPDFLGKQLESIHVDEDSIKLGF